MPRKTGVKKSIAPKAPSGREAAKTEKGKRKGAEVVEEAVHSAVECPVAPVIVQEDGTPLADSLFAALVGGASPARVAADVLQLYNDGDQGELCAAILNLVGKVSGVVNGQLDATAVGADADKNALLDEMFMHIPEGAPPYLFSQKDPKSLKLRSAYGHFFMHVVELCYSRNLSFEKFLLPTIVAWLVTMSESKARCFRHTATATLLFVVDALSGVVRNLNDQVCTGGRNKKQVVAKQRIIEAVVGRCNQIVSQTIHQRARDVAPEIRLTVFEGLRNLMIKHNEDFAENKYFRYFGMALYDKRPEIRSEALTMIQQSLDSISDSGSRMFLFLQYFVKRLVEMCSDVNLRCSELAIGVIRRILCAFSAESEDKQLLDNDMIDSVLLNIFSECPTVRQETGALLHAFVETRVPAGERNGDTGFTAMTELLCTFSSMLRSQHGEVMPERYIVDSLCARAWDIPPLLREYGPMLKLAESNETREVVVALGFLAALLEKLRGCMDLGPVPKDDRKGAHEKKPNVKEKEAMDTLAVALSRDVGALLTGILERHRSDVSVVVAVASVISSMDMNAFVSLEDVSRMKSLMDFMRKVTVALPYCEQSCLSQITAGWNALVSGEHPFAVEARGQLQEVRRHIIKQLTTEGNSSPRVGGQEGEQELLHLWARTSIVSSLLSTEELLPLFRSSFLHHVESRASPELIQLVLTNLVRSVLWQLRDSLGEAHKSLQSADPSDKDGGSSASGVAPQIPESIGEIIHCISVMWTTYSDYDRSDATKLMVDGMLILCDLCVLPHYSLSQTEQDELFGMFARLSESLGSRVLKVRGVLKKVVADASGEGQPAAAAASLRREVSYLESSQMRVTVGVARLIMLNRLAECAAPRFLVQWVHAPTKAVSDVFRCLFRRERERIGDSLALEWSVLLAARKQCAHILPQIGTKLSATHWPLPDKHYSTCVGIVRSGIDLAASSDTDILLGVLPYCSRLQRADAAVLFGALVQRKVLVSSTDRVVIGFVSSLRRAAKLENTVTPSTGTVTKRPREVSRSLDLCGSSLAGSTPSRMLTQMTGGASQAEDQHTPPDGLRASSRLLCADGWRVPSQGDGGAHQPCTAGVGDIDLLLPSTTGEFVESPWRRQEIGSLPVVNASSMASAEHNDSLRRDEFQNSEVFIATMEYE